MKGYYFFFYRQCFPIFPEPTKTLQWSNIKQGFMEPELICTLKVCETCQGTKGRLSAREPAIGISFSSHRLPCVFLIDRPHLIEMTCSWQTAPVFQVDHLSAGKLSSVCHKGVWWRSASHQLWQVHLTGGYTCCVGKVDGRLRSIFHRSHKHYSLA